VNASVRVVRAELRKLLTTRLWWGLLVGLLGASVVGVVATAALAGRDLQGSGAAVPPLSDPATVRAVYGAGVQTAYLCALALGVIAMAGEFRHRTITATLLGEPRRGRLVAAKAVALFAVALGYGVANAVVSVGVGAAVITVRGAEPMLFGDGVPRAVALAVLAVALWALIGFGVGTLIRNQVLALFAAIGVASLADPLLGLLLNVLHAGDAARFLPSQATAALLTPPTTAGGVTSTFLPWWGGALVLLGYAAVSAAIGAAVTLRRDIT
jgi:ABC-type transport system involved in multi-copper enzyme maturation permease subunit